MAGHHAFMAYGRPRHGSGNSRDNQAQPDFPALHDFAPTLFRGGRLKGRWGNAFVRSALSQLLDDGIENRHEEESEKSSSEHPAEYRGADRLPARRPRAARHHQRHDAEDESKR